MTEASYANIPIVALSNIDSPTKFIDIAVPCNNKSSNSIGLMWWMLAREVLRLRGSISRDTPWEVRCFILWYQSTSKQLKLPLQVMPDLFFYRDPEEVEREEAAKEAEVVDVMYNECGPTSHIHCLDCRK